MNDIEICGLIADVLQRYKWQRKHVATCNYHQIRVLSELLKFNVDSKRAKDIMNEFFKENYENTGVLLPKNGRKLGVLFPVGCKTCQSC
jgi:hypothetical protein